MATDNLTRKEREIREREQLILDTARTLLASHGYQMFSMERIASEIEYSKGTIYNHFKSKEDVLSTLCCQSLASLTELFERALSYPGSSREKISALILAYALHAQMRPVDVQNMQSIKTQVMREKVSAELLDQMNCAELKVIEPAQKIVMLAVDEGELKINSEAEISEMITGMWAMGYGTFLLNKAQFDFDKLGLVLPEKQFLNNAQKLLDGYQWQPLSNTFDIEQYYLEIGKKAFPQEMESLKLL